MQVVGGREGGGRKEEHVEKERGMEGREETRNCGGKGKGGISDVEE